MEKEINFNDQENEKYLFENFREKEYYIPNIGLSRVPQRQLDAFTNIMFGRVVFKKDLEILPWVLDTIQKIEEADSGEDKIDSSEGEIDASDLKIKLLNYLLSRDILTGTRIFAPLFFEQFDAVFNRVLILVRACSVVITRVPLAIRQQVIDDILKCIMDVPQITMEAKKTFKRCADAGRIITLTPFETKKAKNSSVQNDDLVKSFLEEYSRQRGGDNDESP